MTIYIAYSDLRQPPRLRGCIRHHNSEWNEQCIFLYFILFYFLFPIPWRKRKQVNMARGILAADIVVNAPPWRKVEGGDPFLSPTVNDKEDAARCNHCYQGRIQGQGVGGLTELRSTLAPIWKKISSTSYRSSPSPSLLSPAPHLRRFRRLHIPVSPSPISPLSRISYYSSVSGLHFVSAAFWSGRCYINIQ